MTAPVAAGGFGWTAAKAGPIYGVYTAAVYLMSLPGGWIADRVLGQRKSVFWGGVIIMMGHIALAVPSVNTFFLGLFLVVLGVGLLKPNISTMVGQLYAPEDERRDAGFSIFYMGINLGALFAPLIVGYLAQDPGWQARLSAWGIRPETSWHWGFGATAVGMFLGLVWYVVDRKALGDAGIHPAVRHRRMPRRRAASSWRAVAAFVAAGVLLAVLSGTGVIALTTEKVADVFGAFLVVVVVLFFLWLFLSGGWTRAERSRLVVILVLFLGASVFWSVFEQAGSTLTLFAQRSTRNELFGHAFPSSWWQAVNSTWIIVMAPVFAWLWVWLGRRNPSSPAKFAVRSLPGCVVVRDHGAGSRACEWRQSRWLVVALQQLFPGDGRRAFAEPGRPERDDAPRTGACRVADDGRVVPRNVGGQFHRRTCGRSVRQVLVADALRRGGGVCARVRDRAGIAGEADQTNAGGRARLTLNISPLATK